MAPEQFAGKEVTVKSDIYALGLVLYELFTGQRAFEAKTATELAKLHQDSAPTKPSSHVEDFDPAIERSILGCLEKQPGDRPATALAVSEALPGGAPLASRSRVGWLIAIAGTIAVAVVLFAWLGWWRAPG
jgi:serine/threonine-protein kinase